MVQSSHTVQSTSLYSTPADQVAMQAQHDRIKASDAQLSAAYQDLQGQIQEQKGRCQSADQNFKQAGNDLEAARMELQRVRLLNDLLGVVVCSSRERRRSMLLSP